MRPTSRWTANCRQAAGRPAVVLQVVEHRDGLESLSAAEATELGQLLQRVAAAMASQRGVARVYVQSFNETAGGHAHVHVVPRFHREDAIGPNLAADVVVPNGFTLAPVLAALTPPSQARAPFTSRVRRLIRGWQQWSIGGRPRHPYRGLQAAMVSTNWGRRLSRVADAAEAYVLLALTVECIAFLLATLVGGTSSWLGWAIGAPIAVVLTLRGLDIAFNQLAILLKEEPSALVSYGRSFLLALGNLVELGLITATTLLVLGFPVGDAVRQGLRVTTFQNDLGDGGWAETCVLTAGMATAIIVAVGGLGVVIGKLAETFHRLD